MIIKWVNLKMTEIDNSTTNSCSNDFYSQLYSQRDIIVLVGNKSWEKEHTNGY